MKKNIQLIIIGFAILFYSCKSHDCINRNTIFEKNSFLSKSYKNELAKEIKILNEEHVSYYLIGYQKINEKEYIDVSIQSINLCAKARVLVEQWDDSLAGVQQSHGQGYIGAELVDLKFDFVEDPEGVQLIYKSVGTIVD